MQVVPFIVSFIEMVFSIVPFIIILPFVIVIPSRMLPPSVVPFVVSFVEMVFSIVDPASVVPIVMIDFADNYPFARHEEDRFVIIPVDLDCIETSFRIVYNHIVVVIDILIDKTRPFDTRNDILRELATTRFPNSPNPTFPFGED